MKKLLYFFIAAFLVASCSSSQFTGNRMDYAHKDVVKSEIDKKETLVAEVQRAEQGVYDVLPVPEELNLQHDVEQPTFLQKRAAKKAQQKLVQNIEEAAVATQSPDALSLAEEVPPTTPKVFITKEKSETKSTSDAKDSGLEKLLLVLLCLFVPFGTVIAVGYVNNWAVMPMVYNLLWYLLCGIPGLIHALIHIFRK